MITSKTFPIKRPLLALIAVVMLGALAIPLLSSPSSAQAGGQRVEVWGTCTPNPKCKKNKTADAFWIRFYRDGIKSSKPAKICWLGNCKKRNRMEETRGEAHAFYTRVGPYRCGTPTKVTLLYGGKSYSARTKIVCKGWA